MAAATITPSRNMQLTEMDHQYLKAYTRWRLGLRKDCPIGWWEGITNERRDEIQASVDWMLRGAEGIWT